MARLLDFYLFSQCQGIVFIYSKIPNRTLEAGMPQKKLHSPYVLSLSVDNRGLGPSQGMCAVQSSIQTNI